MDKASLHAALQSLESLCRQQIAVHEELIALVTRKREALANAQPDRVGELCQLENQKIQRLGELEKQRLQAVAKLTQMVQPQAKEPMRMRELAECFTGPIREQLLALRDELVRRMEQVREHAAVARRATESLVRHMQGVVQTIGSNSTGVTTYGRSGDRPTAATAVSTFNMTA